MKVVRGMQMDLAGQEGREEGHKVVWRRRATALRNLEGMDWVTARWGARSLGCCMAISMEQWHEAQAACVCMNTSYWPIRGNGPSRQQEKKLARFSDPLQRIPFWFSHHFWWRSLQGGVVSKTTERKSKRQGSPRGCVLHGEALMKHMWSFFKRKIWFIQWYWSGICWYLISCRLGIASEGAAATAFFQIWFWG